MNNPLYIKASGSYSEIYYPDGGKVVKSKHLKLIHRSYPYMIKCHRSYLIDSSKITGYNCREIYLGSIKIPVATRKGNIKKFINN